MVWERFRMFGTTSGAPVGNCSWISQPLHISGLWCSVEHMENIGVHYCETLLRWQQQFQNNRRYCLSATCRPNYVCWRDFGEYLPRVNMTGSRRKYPAVFVFVHQQRKFVEAYYSLLGVIQSLEILMKVRLISWKYLFASTAKYCNLVSARSSSACGITISSTVLRVSSLAP